LATSETSAGAASQSSPRCSLPALGLAALGIVFGDIGASPLYTFKTVLDLTGAKPETGAILGSLSLILWTLIIVTSVKYVGFAMRVDNDGEGGILALMSLLASRSSTGRRSSPSACSGQRLSMATAPSRARCRARRPS
jgi:K+ transporter